MSQKAAIVMAAKLTARLAALCALCFVTRCEAFAKPSSTRDCARLVSASGNVTVIGCGDTKDCTAIENVESKLALLNGELQKMVDTFQQLQPQRTKRVKAPRPREIAGHGSLQHVVSTSALSRPLPDATRPSSPKPSKTLVFLEEGSAYAQNVLFYGARSFYVAWAKNHRGRSNFLTSRYFMPTFSEASCFVIESGAEPLRSTLNGRCMYDVDAGAADAIRAVDCPLCTMYRVAYLDRPIKYTESVHVIENASVDSVGTVSAQGWRFVPNQCNADALPVDQPGTLQRRDVVFVASQNFGSAYYHKIVECFTRLAPYVTFLRANEHVAVHVPDKNELTLWLARQLGISESRLVEGDVEARLVLSPAGSGCGGLPMLRAQALNRALRAGATPIADDGERAPSDTIVLIERTVTRRLSSHEGVRRGLQDLSKKMGLRLVVFSDAATVPHDQTRDVFSRAVLIVGSHGAGLANMMFAVPGTAIVEALCHEPHTNICFAVLASQLGMRYHGILSRETACQDMVHVDVDDVLRAARAMLAHQS